MNPAINAWIGPDKIENNVNTKKDTPNTNENSFVPMNGVEIEENISEMYV